MVPLNKKTISVYIIMAQRCHENEITKEFYFGAICQTRLTDRGAHPLNCRSFLRSVQILPKRT